MHTRSCKAIHHHCSVWPSHAFSCKSQYVFVSHMTSFYAAMYSRTHAIHHQGTYPTVITVLIALQKTASKITSSVRDTPTQSMEFAVRRNTNLGATSSSQSEVFPNRRTMAITTRGTIRTQGTTLRPSTLQIHDSESSLNATMLVSEDVESQCMRRSAGTSELQLDSTVYGRSDSAEDCSRNKELKG